MVNTVPSDYITGTITLTNGSADFTGTGTGWLAMMFRQGDMILDLPDAPEYIAIIDEVTTNTAGTLTRPWLGPTLTGAYRMRYQWDAGRVTAMSAFLREELGNGNLQAFAALVGSAGGVPVFIGPGAMEVRPATDFVNGVAYDVQVDTLADRAAFDGQSQGFAVLVSDVGDGRSALYSKASNTVGDWTDPAYITGPIGAAPAFAAGTTTTVPPGTPADVDLVPDGSGGYLFDFDIPAGEGFVSRGAYSGATAYVKGDVVQNNGSSWIAKIATMGNAPPVLPTVSNTWWELLAAAGMNGTGTGDVVGPAGAIAGRLAVFSDTSGKIIADGGASVADLTNPALASQAEAVTGSDNSKMMTPLRVLQAIAAQTKRIRGVEIRTVSGEVTTTSLTLLDPSTTQSFNATSATSSLLIISYVQQETERSGSVGTSGVSTQIKYYTGSIYSVSSTSQQSVDTDGLGPTRILRGQLTQATILTSAQKRSDVTSGSGQWTFGNAFASFATGCIAKLKNQTFIIVEFEP